MKGITVGEFYDRLRKKLKLSIIAGSEGLDRRVKVGELNRPGLALAGYFDFFASGRGQVLGKVEISFLRQMRKDHRERRIRELLEHGIPFCIVARNYVPPGELIREGNRLKIPIFRSSLITMVLVNKATIFFEDEFAPTTTKGGNLLEVFGVGVLIRGKSGVGKSECALALIQKGHRLVADDVVRIRLQDGKVLIGSGAELTRHHMEIRGLGIINVQTLYGAGCVRESIKIDQVVTLEEWDSSREYERLGLEERTASIMGINLPRIVIPVRPGRDIALLIETAALNHRLKKMGYHAARDLNRDLIKLMRK